MELVTHRCGARLWRVETGGVARIVRYYRHSDQKEIHDCEQCGENLSDAALTGERGEAIAQRTADALGRAAQAEDLFSD